MQGPTRHPRDIEVGIALFVFLVSLREELRARKGARTLMRDQQQQPLPRYVTRDRLKGGAQAYSFQAYPGGPRIRLRGELGTPEFRAAYSSALVDAIVAEKDDDWRELERYHGLQRRRDVHRTKRAVA